MKFVMSIRSFHLVNCLLLPFSAFATQFVGEHAGEIWIDGPADVQPGSDPGNPDVVIDESGRSIWVWDGTPASTRKTGQMSLKYVAGFSARIWLPRARTFESIICLPIHSHRQERQATARTDSSWSGRAMPAPAMTTLCRA